MPAPNQWYILCNDAYLLKCKTQSQGEGKACEIFTIMYLQLEL